MMPVSWTAGAEADAARVLDALGSPTRREIIDLLRGGPKPVGVIAAALPISRPAVSKHLRILQSAGLVDFRPSGASNLFYLDPVGFREARAYIEQFWDDALSNVKRLAEAAAEEPDVE